MRPAETCLWFSQSTQLLFPCLAPWLKSWHFKLPTRTRASLSGSSRMRYRWGKRSSTTGVACQLHAEWSWDRTKSGCSRILLRTSALRCLPTDCTSTHFVVQSLSASLNAARRELGQEGSKLWSWRGVSGRISPLPSALCHPRSHAKSTSWWCTPDSGPWSLSIWIADVSEKGARRQGTWGWCPGCTYLRCIGSRTWSCIAPSKAAEFVSPECSFRWWVFAKRVTCLIRAGRGLPEPKLTLVWLLQVLVVGRKSECLLLSSW